MNSYQLPEEKLSPYCRGFWDDKNKKFFDTNSMDVINCCMESCKDHIEYCFNQCGQKYGPNGTESDFWHNTRCNKQCDELIDNCESGCMEIYSDGLKIISKCAKEKNCGNFPLFSPECLHKNKDDIINCCNKNCVANQSTDCSHNFCDDFFDHLAGGTQFPLAKIKNSHLLDKSLFAKAENNEVYLFYIIIGVLSILGLYIVKSLLDKK